MKKKEQIICSVKLYKKLEKGFTIWNVIRNWKKALQPGAL